jgi:hypothetical protein
MCRRTRCGEREQRTRAGARWTAGAYGATPRARHHRPHRHATPETVLAAAAKRGNARTDLGIRSRLRRHLRAEAGRSRRSVRPSARWPVPRGATPYARADHRALARARAPPSVRRGVVSTPRRTRRGRGYKSLRRAALGFLKEAEPLIRSSRSARAFPRGGEDGLWRGMWRPAFATNDRVRTASVIEKLPRAACSRWDARTFRGTGPETRSRSDGG